MNTNCYEYEVYTFVDLHSSQPQRCTHSKQRSENREDINQISDPTIDPISNQRVETSLHGHWHSLPEGQETQDDADNHVHNPAVYPPMEEGQVDSPLGQFVVWHVFVLGVTVRAHVVPHWLRDPEEEEANTLSACEQHGEPSNIVILRLFVVLS